MNLICTVFWHDWKEAEQDKPDVAVPKSWHGPMRLFVCQRCGKTDWRWPIGV